MRMICKFLVVTWLTTPWFAHRAVADGLEVGVTVGAHVFSSNSELGVPDRMGGASPQSSGLLGGRVGYAFLPTFTGEFELVMIPTVDDAADRGALVLGATAQVRYQPFGETLMGGKLHPFVMAGYGLLAVRTDAEQLRNDADQALSWGLGTHYALTHAMELRIDAKHLIVPDRTDNGATSNFELTAGVTWHFGRGSRALASSASVAGATTSAPAAASAGPAAPGAQPQVAPAGAATIEAPVAPDQDGDGVVLPYDACPQVAEDRDGFQDDDGCPDPDNDGDGILDARDRCPIEPEVPNGYNDEDGCPELSHPELADVQFAHNSEGFSGEAAVQLDTAFRALQNNPALRLELGGHSSTDESSKLSLRRAQTVKDYFQRRGIAPARLRAVGYRAEQPLSQDKSSAGRARNRRVSMRMLALDAK